MRRTDNPSSSPARGLPGAGHPPRPSYAELHRMGHRAFVKTSPDTARAAHDLRRIIGVGFLTGLAGIAMLGQDIVIAKYFAISDEVDAYQLAASFPTLLINVLAGGTLLAVLVPEFSQRVLRHDDREIVALIGYARRTLATLLAAIAAGWLLLYPLLPTGVAQAQDAAPLLTRHLLWLVAPVLFFSGLAGIDAAHLNSRHRFLATSIFPAFLPLGTIAFTVLFSEHVGIYSTAAGLLFGSVCQWLTGRWLTQAALPFAPTKERPTIANSLNKPYLANVLSSASLAGIIATDILFASNQSPGALATYNYASRPVTLFLAFFTASIGNVILPTFSRLAAQGNWSELRRRARRWIYATTGASLFLVALWSWRCNEFVSLLYQRGAFQAIHTTQVAAIQAVYLFQIPFYLTAVVGVRVLNSLRSHRPLAVINIVAFVTNLAIDTWLTPTLSLKGIAIGTDAAFAIWSLLIVGHALTTLHHATLCSPSHPPRYPQ